MAVSRSLGDSQFKGQGGQPRGSEAPANMKGQLVSPEPAVKSVRLDPQDRVVIVASGECKHSSHFWPSAKYQSCELNGVHNILELQQAPTLTPGPRSDSWLKFTFLAGVVILISGFGWVYAVLITAIDARFATWCMLRCNFLDLPTTENGARLLVYHCCCLYTTARRRGIKTSLFSVVRYLLTYLFGSPRQTPAHGDAHSCPL